MADNQKPKMATDAVITIRGPKGESPLVLDGQPFPYAIADRPITVEVDRKNVHIINVAIQVDRSVSIVDAVSVREIQDAEDRA